MGTIKSVKKGLRQSSASMAIHSAPKSTTSLTDGQVKTLAALRTMARKQAPQRAKILKVLVAELQKREELQKDELGALRPTPARIIDRRMKLNIPVTLSKEALTFLSELEGKKDLVASEGVKTSTPRTFRLSKGLTTGSLLLRKDEAGKEIPLGKVRIERTPGKDKSLFDGSGVRFEFDEKAKQLDIIFRCPPCPAALTSPSSLRQGDLGYRAWMAKKKVPGATIGKNQPKGITGPPERKPVMATPAGEEMDQKDSGHNGSSGNDRSSAKQPPTGFEDWGTRLSDVRLDNVAWHDFSAYQTILDPEYVKPGTSGPPFPFNPGKEWEKEPGPAPKEKPGAVYAGTSAAMKISVALEEESHVSSADHDAFIAILSTTLRKCIDKCLSLPHDWLSDAIAVPLHTLLMSALTWDPALVADFMEWIWSGGNTWGQYQQIIDALVGNGYWVNEGWFSSYEDHEYFARAVHLPESEGGNSNISEPVSESIREWLSSWANGSIPNGMGLSSTESEDVSRNQFYLDWKRALATLSKKLPDATTKPETPPAPYPFDFYRPGSWNLGLQLNFRQEWRSLGDQRGEIVKTIPLGPKQVEKISTRILRRTKTTHTSENLKSVESTTETSDTTKDSSELVKEASDSSHYVLKADGSFSIGPIGGSVSGPSYEDTSTEQTKQTNAHLSEVMQKTASKIRSETKVVISTESESTFESTVASEIQNPNDEIAVTYIYSKLQRQYEIFTSLAEVQNVVMVAEPVWSPTEIDDEWVRKYDWIIAKVLLDDSFRDVLSSFGQDMQQEALSPDVIQNIGDNVTRATGALNTLAEKVGSLSLSRVDLSQEAQRSYLETQKAELERRRSRELLVQKQKRFLQHVRDNILHYCRAIWSQEDPQQRMLRYRKLGAKVPLTWKYQTTAENVNTMLTGITESESMRPIGGNNFRLEGEFVGEGTLVDLADIINPAGPIGFHGNYAIYYIRPEYCYTDMFPMLQILKTPYLYYPKGDPTHPALMDPQLKKLTIDNEGIGPDEGDEKIEMTQYVPELRLALEIAGSIEAMEVRDADVFKNYYPEYLFRKEQSRRFLLETNNVVVDLFPGTGSALEPFKLRHREIDLQKAEEEREKMQLENERRRCLLAEGKFGVPDIEKVTLITGDGEIFGALVAGLVTADAKDHTKLLGTEH